MRRAFGDMPVIVLTRGVPARDPGWDDATSNAFEARWKAGHDTLAARSRRGKSVVVPGAGHFIQLAKPDAVIAAIEEVVAEVRGGR